MYCADPVFIDQDYRYIVRGDLQIVGNNKLRTIYPYDLNYHLKNEYKKDLTHFLMGNKFETLPKKQDRVFHGTIHQSNNSFSFDEFFIKLKYHLPTMYVSVVYNFVVSIGGFLSLIQSF